MDCTAATTYFNAIRFIVASCSAIFDVEDSCLEVNGYVDGRKGIGPFEEQLAAIADVNKIVDILGVDKGALLGLLRFLLQLKVLCDF